MSDDERIARLTELARRVPEWREYENVRVVIRERSAGVYGNKDECLLSLLTPLATCGDALEAALLVLAGEPPYSHEREWRALEQQLADAELRARARQP